MSEKSPNVPSGWKETTLRAVSENVAYGYTESASDKKIGPKFLRITDIQNDFIDWESVPYCPISDSDFKKYKLEKGDIVIARTGNSTGATATIKDDIEAVFASYLIRFRIDEIKAEWKFIDFVLRSQYWKSFVRSVKGGSAQGGANAKDFSDFSFILPLISEQRAIAAVLSSFDDKIKLLGAQNKTLENVAQTLFKDWFIDFEFPDQNGKPYKSNGGKMIDSEIGDIPEQWRVCPFSETIETIGGGTPKTTVSEYWGGDIPWFAVTDAPSDSDIFIIDTDKTITNLGLENSSTKILAEGTTIISARGTVGKVAMAGVPMAMNQSCYGLRGKNAGPIFTFYSTRNLVGILKRLSHGAVFDTITRDTFSGVTIPVPLKSLCDSFEVAAFPITSKIRSNLISIKTLSKIREALLPKLMKGEVRVRNLKD